MKVERPLRLRRVNRLTAALTKTAQRVLRKALEKHGWNLARAGAELGMDRTNLAHALERWGMAAEKEAARARGELRAGGRR